MKSISKIVIGLHAHTYFVRFTVENWKTNTVLLLLRSPLNGLKHATAMTQVCVGGCRRFTRDSNEGYPSPRSLADKPERDGESSRRKRSIEFRNVSHTTRSSFTFASFTAAAAAGLLSRASSYRDLSPPPSARAATAYHYKYHTSIMMIYVPGEKVDL